MATCSWRFSAWEAVAFKGQFNRAMAVPWPTLRTSCGPCLCSFLFSCARRGPGHSTSEDYIYGTPPPLTHSRSKTWQKSTKLGETSWRLSKASAWKRAVTPDKCLRLGSRRDALLAAAGSKARPTIVGDASRGSSSLDFSECLVTHSQQLQALGSLFFGFKGPSGRLQAEARQRWAKA